MTTNNLLNLHEGLNGLISIDKGYALGSAPCFLTRQFKLTQTMEYWKDIEGYEGLYYNVQRSCISKVQLRTRWTHI